MYPQRDKPSSRNTMTRNYVNSLREMQIMMMMIATFRLRYC